MTEQPPPEKPAVFILNLDKDQQYEGLFDFIYSDLISSLAAKYDVRRARTLSEAQSYLNEQQPAAILLPDPAVTVKKNSAVLGQVRNYVQAGGFAIFACAFSSFITPPAMNKFWASWGLGWKSGSYTRTDVYLNRSVPQLPSSSMPNEYSQKALFVANVASEDSVYRPGSEETYVRPNEAAVALTKVGEGWLAYIGDVNNEEGSQAVIHSLLELATKPLKSE